MSSVAWEVISRLIMVLAIPHSVALAAAKFISISTKRRLSHLAAFMETSALLALAFVSGAVIHGIATAPIGPDDLPVTEEEVTHAVGLGSTSGTYLFIFVLILATLLVCHAAFTWTLFFRGKKTAAIGLGGPPLLVAFLNVGFWNWAGDRFDVGWTQIPVWGAFLLAFGPSVLLFLGIVWVRSSPSIVAKVAGWLDQPPGRSVTGQGAANQQAGAAASSQ